VALTFDDAYRGSLEFGVREVVSRGLPALVFVSPGLLGTLGFWWDLLSDPGLGGVEPEVRKYALCSLGGGQEQILHWAASVGRAVQEVPELYQPASEAEVLATEGVEGVALGSHTWSHVNLTAVPPGDATVEMAKPLEWLESVPSARKLISYPYGMWDPSLEGAAREIGYRAGFLVHGGITTLRRVRSATFTIPRLNIPRGLTTEGFLARVSGVWT
jgi:peptidoglycan/xylan/chitin deacetylase (PgdA/CDA1 family)